MTRDVARMAFGMALIPLLAGLSWMSSTLITSLGFQGKSQWPGFLALEISAFVGVIVWLALWHRRVVWATSRRIWTIVLIVLMLAAPAHVLIPPSDQTSLTGIGAALLDSARGTASLFALALWFMGTAWAWRSPAEVAVRREMPVEVNCPRCGYCLTGLREVRCPECNWVSTVDGVARMALDAAADA